MKWRKNTGWLMAGGQGVYGAPAGRLLLVLMLICTVMGLQPPARVHAEEPGSGPTIDLTTDANNDSIPDELANAVEAVAASDDQQAAIKDLVSRLPYSPETRDLQQQAEALHAQLTEDTDSAEAEQIHKKIQALTEQMQADPNYAKTIEALTTMFAPEEMKDEVEKQHVNWSLLQPGDILLHRDYLSAPSYFYAMAFSHTGNYHGNSLVYESEFRGVRLQPLAVNWQGGLKFTALARNTAATFWQVTDALYAREAQYGTDGRTRYNFWFPDKRTDRRLYCSQLTWKIHQLTGVDLDSNGSAYLLWLGSRYGVWAIPLIGLPAVAPDEVWLSRYVRTYYYGWA